MAALEIQCLLDENQMSALTDYVSTWMYRFQPCEMEDIDICFDTMSVRLCVDFNIGIDNIQLKQAEILDEYWNIVDADSAVLRSRLRQMIEGYNYAEQQLTNTCHIVRNEQQNNLLNYR